MEFYPPDDPRSGRTLRLYAALAAFPPLHGLAMLVLLHNCNSDRVVPAFSLLSALPPALGLLLFVIQSLFRTFFWESMLAAGGVVLACCLCSQVTYVFLAAMSC